MDVKYFATGDHVRIKPGFKVEEFPSETADNWGGEIINIRFMDDEIAVYEVVFDAPTLKGFSLPYLEFLAMEGLGIEEYCFLEESLQHSTQRGTSQEREDAAEEALSKVWHIISDDDDDEYDEDDDEDFEEEPLSSSIPALMPKPKLKAWAKFSKNATITVVYKDGKQKTGKFKRLEADLDKGLCDLL